MRGNRRKQAVFDGDVMQFNVRASNKWCDMQQKICSWVTLQPARCNLASRRAMACVLRSGSTGRKTMPVAYCHVHMSASTQLVVSSRERSIDSLRVVESHQAIER